MRTRHAVCWVCSSMGCLMALGSCAGPTEHAATPDTAQATPAPLPGIENLHMLRPGLVSGGEPDGAIGYASLRSMGIRTVISTDAVAPNAEQAAISGIRVVHLPIGYDGVPEERALQLAAAIRDLPGPIYVHCHHGKHRGPAALCVGALGAGLITKQEALEYMETAGTSRQYAGLWRDAEAAQPIRPAGLAGIAAALPEADVPEGTPGAMSLLDRANERLWIVADNGWAVPDDHPDLAPASDAGLIHNLLRSLEDSQEIDAHGRAYAALLAKAAEHAKSLESAITANDTDASTRSLDALHDSCIECHRGYRN